MVEAIVGNLEIPDHDEEELEPLESQPPFMGILICEWIAMKLCGSCFSTKPPVLRQDSSRSEV